MIKLFIKKKIKNRKEYKSSKQLNGLMKIIQKKCFLAWKLTMNIKKILNNFKSKLNNFIIKKLLNDVLASWKFTWINENKKNCYLFFFLKKKYLLIIKKK